MTTNVQGPEHGGRGRDELLALLAEARAAIRLSSAAYDQGFGGEAKRLAVTIRVLVHDTRQSHSRLGDKAQIRFHHLERSLNPANLMSESLLTMTRVAGSGAVYQPLLDNGPPRRWVASPFEPWWNQPVMKNQDGTVATRKDLVLGLANKQGGAHVDPKLDGLYERLFRANFLGWTFVKGDAAPVPVLGAEGAALRHIAFEVERSLEAYYGV